MINYEPIKLIIMSVESIKKEVIEGILHVIKIIRYSNGMRVKRTYTVFMVHVDSEILPQLTGNEQQRTTV